MSLAPRVVLVHRRTELDELLARQGTRGQAAFFLSTRGRRIEDVEARHEATARALREVAAAIPLDWRRGSVERADLSRFLFAPDDVVAVVGQDALVANVAKYLDGQPVIGVDPEPRRNPGVLVRHEPRTCTRLLRIATSRELAEHVELRTMVEARTDDRHLLVALNEIYVGHAGHQTARYTLRPADGRFERHSSLPLPSPTEERLAWFVREAWPSPVTGTALTEGLLADEVLTVSVESDRLVAFGDGIEADALELRWGQSVELRVATRRLHLVV